MHKFSSCAHFFIVSSIPHSQSGDCCKEELSLPILWFRASWQEIFQPPISVRCDFVSNSQKGHDFARCHAAFKLLLWIFLCSFIDMRWWWYTIMHSLDTLLIFSFVLRATFTKIIVWKVLGELTFEMTHQPTTWALIGFRGVVAVCVCISGRLGLALLWWL
jgi:hypothetical protein